MLEIDATCDIFLGNEIAVVVALVAAVNSSKLAHGPMVRQAPVGPSGSGPISEAAGPRPVQRFGAKRGRNLASAHAARGATPEERVEPCRRAVLGATAVAPEELRGPETALRQRLVRLDGLDDVENDFTEIAWAAVHEVDEAAKRRARCRRRRASPRADRT